jgi:hypothetical protein
LKLAETAFPLTGQPVQGIFVPESSLFRVFDFVFARAIASAQAIYQRLCLPGYAQASYVDFMNESEAARALLTDHGQTAQIFAFCMALTTERHAAELGGMSPVMQRTRYAWLPCSLALTCCAVLDFPFASWFCGLGLLRSDGAPG